MRNTATTRTTAACTMVTLEGIEGYLCLTDMLGASQNGKVY